jgi:hypothetical protein
MKIIRVAYADNATFGVFINDDGMPFAVTAELTWLNNEVGVSCIPTGIYTCRRIISPRFGETFEIEEVPGRTHILFHKGNVPAADSKGCILVGEQFEPPGIAYSGKGFGEFMSLLKDVNSFILVIT